MSKFKEIYDLRQSIFETGNYDSAVLKISDLASSELETNSSEIDKAEQQLLGFCFAKNGGNVSDLVSSMGLTVKEWSLIKEKYPIDSYIKEEFIRNIDLHFKNH